MPQSWIGAVLVAPARYLIGQHRSVASPNDPAAMFHEARQELGLAAEA